MLKNFNHPVIGELHENSRIQFSKSSIVLGKYNSKYCRDRERNTWVKMWETVKVSSSGAFIGISSIYGETDVPTAEQENCWTSIVHQLDGLVEKCLNLIAITPNEMDDMSGVLIEDFRLEEIDISDPSRISMQFTNDIASNRGFGPTVYFDEGEPSHVVWET